MLTTTNQCKDYDFSLEFYWSPFLVKLNELKNGSKVLKLNELTEAWRWQDADVMVFNTGHWWTHRGRSRTYVNLVSYLHTHNKRYRELKIDENQFL